MVRSATALFAVLILAGFQPAQQVTTHTVVKGDCLWNLAQTYYGNPWGWRRIWDANRSLVSDPNLIFPGQVLTIPAKAAEVHEVEVQAPPAQNVPAPVPGATAGETGGQPTIFRRNQTARTTVVTGSTAPPLAVSRSDVYSAPRLVRPSEEVAHDGVLEAFADGASRSKTPRPFDKVRVRFTSPPASVGTDLQVFRVTKTIRDVGRVVTPTGVVHVDTVDDSTAVVIVTSEFGRIQLGDFVGPMPSYSLTPGEQAQDVSGGGRAMIMGFAGSAVVQEVGQVAFLDQGLADGVAVGDEYELVNPALGSDPVEGRLTVVGVTQNVAAARIVQMNDVVFRQGVVVQLTRKMR
ncbi:MAG: LysM peptidoglycan-binding domain-containing protein [Gemmatimonadetes bacterium]|nr:LysM peptidoglycan-binding domain-containing protein [Gemmatimonadota bacterium]